MTEKTFIKLLSDLNKGVPIAELTFFHLIANVYYGIYWNYSLENLKSHSSLYPKKMYLVKNELDTWVSIVYDANGDLHWFTLSQWRGSGVLSKALSEHIIPHIFSRNKKKEIIISIDPNIQEYTASKNLALKLGFKKSHFENETEYYRKSRPKKLNTFDTKNETVILNELINLSRVISNYSHLFCTLSGFTTISNDVNKVLPSFEKKLSILKCELEDLLWDEEQKKQQS